MLAKRYFCPSVTGLLSNTESQVLLVYWISTQSTPCKAIDTHGRCTYLGYNHSELAKQDRTRPVCKLRPSHSPVAKLLQTADHLKLSFVVIRQYNIPLVITQTIHFFVRSELESKSGPIFQARTSWIRIEDAVFLYPF